MKIEQKYNEIVEKIKELHRTGDYLTKKQMETILPELQENRNEKIRKALIGKVEALKSSSFKYFYSDVTCDETLEWLNKIKVEEWTIEDSERYDSCLRRLQSNSLIQPETINSLWFKKHCGPQSHWKPSEEQLKALKMVVNAVSLEELNSLFEDLLKL